MSKFKPDIPYTQNFMVGAMTNKYKIIEGCYYSGDIDSMDLIMDIDILLNQAQLTMKQMEVVKLHYFEQYSQGEVAKKLGITQQAVDSHISNVKKKINKVLEEWKEADKYEQHNRKI